MGWKGDKNLAKKTKATTGRTKVKALPKSQRELTGKDMRKIKGGAGKNVTTIKWGDVKM